MNIFREILCLSDMSESRHTTFTFTPATRTARDDNHLGTATISLAKNSYFQEKKTRSCVKKCFVKRHKKELRHICEHVNNKGILRKRCIAVALFCTMTNKCNKQIITLLHVMTLSYHPQGACNQYLAKLHKYIKCSCW